jgi:hypothetical protein
MTTAHVSSAPTGSLSELDRRAAEAARIAHDELHPEFAHSEVPYFYHKVARIIIRDIGKGLI